jgi:hypothetical protein
MMTLYKIITFDNWGKILKELDEFECLKENCENPESWSICKLFIILMIFFKNIFLNIFI